MEFIGWLGSSLLAICGLPQALQSIKDKHSDGLNWGFILFWFIGEILTLIYVMPKFDLPLIFNYCANLVFLAIIIYFKLFPRK